MLALLEAEEGGQDEEQHNVTTREINGKKSRREVIRAGTMHRTIWGLGNRRVTAKQCRLLPHKHEEEGVDDPMFEQDEIGRAHV